MFGDSGLDEIEDAKRVAKIINALSSPIRLLIVCKLIDGEKSVGELVEMTGTTMGNISQHLRILEDNGILISNKDGNKVFYSIKNRRIIKLIKGIKELCKEQVI
ncbi:MAG: ArsR/SmtB family transcription factor [Myxococcota bacterium]